MLIDVYFSHVKTLVYLAIQIMNKNFKGPLNIKRKIENLRSTVTYPKSLALLDPNWRNWFRISLSLSVVVIGLRDTLY